MCGEKDDFKDSSLVSRGGGSPRSYWTIGQEKRGGKGVGSFLRMQDGGKEKWAGEKDLVENAKTSVFKSEKK